MKAAAWSAPVIAVAAATPAAAASTVEGFDLAVQGMSMGATFTFYSSDGQTRYMAGEPGSVLVMNEGTETAPAGTVAQVTYDNRIHTPTSTGYRFVENDETTAADFTIVSTDGNSSTLAFVVQTPVPVNTTIDNALVLDIDFVTDVEPPNDRFDNYVPLQYTLVADGDIDPINNVHGPFPATVVEP